MTEVVISAAVSLDGRLAGPGDDVSWLDAYPADEFGFDAFLETVDAIVMGRRSFEAGKRLGPWPYGERACVVASHTPLETELPFLSRFEGPLSGLIADLRAKGKKRVWLMGGGDVFAQALDANLVDRIELAIIPHILGAGPYWRPEGNGQGAFARTECRVTPSGALAVSLTRAPGF